MLRPLLTVLLAVPFMFCSLAQNPPKREFRGAWIATVSNIDWPNRTQTPTQQRSAMLTILTHHQATGINAIFGQIRSNCDAMYLSSIEPWSIDLTGEQGRAPSPLWDPLQFMIDESHKRGMEFHAWINPYRVASSTNNLNTYKLSHVGKQHPEWLLNYGSTTAIALNPGLPQVRDYILSVITDILHRYDVDGIHFDDYFYPPGTFNDDAAYNADPRGFTVRADWRRDNVNLLIKRVYDSVQAIKPWVKFGVSPTGIYRNSTNPAIGTPTAGLEHYNAVYADSKKWLQEGWIDYLAPQVYWYIGQPGADYSKIVPWYNNIAPNTGVQRRNLYIGMAGYKVGDAGWPKEMFPNEVRLNRSYPNINGQAVYNTTALRSSARLGFRDSLRLFFYNKPSLMPLMPWRDNTPPEAPAELTAIRTGDEKVILNWTKPADADDELDKVKRFVVYRSEDPSIDLSNANNILSLTVDGNPGFEDRTIEAGKNYYYTVTSLDRFHNESPSSNAVADVPPTIVCPGNQKLSLDSACVVYLPDYTSLASVSSGGTVVQTPEALTALNGTGVYTITLTATNAVGQQVSCSFNVTVEDVTSPAFTIIPENVSTGNDAGNCSAIVALSIPSASDNCTLSGVAGVRSDGKPLTEAFPKGTTTITWTATDAAGNTAIQMQSVTVQDLEAPVITAAAATPAALWPPNHKMKEVTVSYQVTDNCSAVTTTLSVSSNEPEYGTGEGDKGPDWEIVDNHRVKLRAERAGSGSGRIYTITIRAVDADGNVSTQNVEVPVPHDHSEVTIRKDDGVVNEPSKSLQVLATPNPGKVQFTLNLKSVSGKAVSLRVLDNTGKLVESRTAVLANGRITLGARYKPGIYYVELTQGSEKVTLKLVKQ